MPKELTPVVSATKINMLRQCGYRFLKHYTRDVPSSRTQKISFLLHTFIEFYGKHCMKEGVKRDEDVAEKLLAKVEANDKVDPEFAREVRELATPFIAEFEWPVDDVAKAREKHPDLEEYYWFEWSTAWGFSDWEEGSKAEPIEIDESDGPSPETAFRCVIDFAWLSIHTGRKLNLNCYDWKLIPVEEQLADKPDAKIPQKRGGAPKDTQLYLQLAPIRELIRESGLDPHMTTTGIKIGHYYPKSGHHGFTSAIKPKYIDSIGVWSVIRNMYREIEAAIEKDEFECELNMGCRACEFGPYKGNGTCPLHLDQQRISAELMGEEPPQQKTDEPEAEPEPTHPVDAKSFLQAVTTICKDHGVKLERKCPNDTIEVVPLAEDESNLLFVEEIAGWNRDKSTEAAYYELIATCKRSRLTIAPENPDDELRFASLEESGEEPDRFANIVINPDGGTDDEKRGSLTEEEVIPIVNPDGTYGGSNCRHNCPGPGWIHLVHDIDSSGKVINCVGGIIDAWDYKGHRMIGGSGGWEVWDIEKRHNCGYRATKSRAKEMVDARVAGDRVPRNDPADMEPDEYVPVMDGDKPAGTVTTTCDEKPSTGKEGESLVVDLPDEPRVESAERNGSTVTLNLENKMAGGYQVARQKKDPYFKIFLSGPEKIGKTRSVLEAFAERREAPDDDTPARVVFLDLEDGTRHYAGEFAFHVMTAGKKDVLRLPESNSKLEAIIERLKNTINNLPDGADTLVIDSFTLLYHAIRRLWTAKYLAREIDSKGNHGDYYVLQPRDWNNINDEVNKIALALHRANHNVVLIGRVKRAYSDDGNGSFMTPDGETHDAYRSVGYDFDTVVRVENDGDELIAHTIGDRSHRLPDGRWKWTQKALKKALRVRSQEAEEEVPTTKVARSEEAEKPEKKLDPTPEPEPEPETAPEESTDGGEPEPVVDDIDRDQPVTKATLQKIVREKKELAKAKKMTLDAEDKKWLNALDEVRENATTCRDFTEGEALELIDQLKALWI